MGLEVEARFRAADRSPLDRLAADASLGRATLGEPTTYLEQDRYLDTHAGRLAAARWACRLRTRGDRTVVSLKGPPDRSPAGWLHRRPELEGPAAPVTDAAAWPPSEARERLLALSAGEPLATRITLLQERTTRSVSMAGATVGILSLDSVTPVDLDGARLGLFHVVELELVATANVERHLGPLARVLAARSGLTPEPRTKLELALERLPGPTEPRAAGAG